MKNTMSEMMNKLEGMNRLDEAEDRISNLEDWVTEGYSIRTVTRKKNKKK